MDEKKIPGSLPAGPGFACKREVADLALVAMWAAQVRERLEEDKARHFLNGGMVSDSDTPRNFDDEGPE